jgi:hypothetical protein
VAEAVAGLGRARQDGAAFHGDGCGNQIEARVSFIATQPEYTPPVIYSERAAQQAGVPGRGAAVQPADAARLRRASRWTCGAAAKAPEHAQAP